MILLPFYSAIPKIEQLHAGFKPRVIDSPILFSGLLYVVLKNTSTTLEVEIFVIDAI